MYHQLLPAEKTGQIPPIHFLNLKVRLPPSCQQHENESSAPSVCDKQQWLLDDAVNANVIC